jgi:hypothetical protein
MNHRQNKLIKDTEKKCITIMIGALARFEEFFGHLWEKEGDAESDKLHDIWQQVRGSVLNFGNHQTRLAVEDLYRYFLDHKPSSNGQYHYEFKLDKKEGDSRYEN